MICIAAFCLIRINEWMDGCIQLQSLLEQGLHKYIYLVIYNLLVSNDVNASSVT